MAESIRSLTIKLGYDVDTTGANMLKSSFSNLQKSLNRLSSNYERSINKMGKANRRFVVTAGDLVNAVKKIASVGKAVFTAFADIQQARVTLAFRTSKEEADKLIKRIAAITQATGGYVSQIDALNAVSFGGNITGQMDFFINNLEKIIKLSKVSNVDFKEASAAIAQFITTGQGLDRLVEFKIISAAQKEAFEVSGAAKLIGQQGIRARTAQAQEFLDIGAPRVELFFKEFQKTGGAAIDQLKTSVEDTNILVGEVLNPAIVELVTGLKDSTNNFKNALKKNSSFVDAWTASFNSEAARSIIKLFGGVTGDQVQQNSVNPITNNRQQTNQQTNVTDQSTTVINVNGAGDPEKVAKKVMDETNKKVIQNSLRRTIPQALNTTIIPAESP